VIYVWEIAAVVSTKKTMLYLYDAVPVYHGQFNQEERKEICAMISKTNRVAQVWLNKCRENAERYNLVVKVLSKEKGRGVHAQANVRQLGTRLCYYTGKIHVYAKREPGGFMDAYAMQLKEFTLDCSGMAVYPYVISHWRHVRAQPFHAELVNHSCAPNCIAEELVFKRGYLSIVCLKNTKAICRGQEVVFHYGDSYFNTADMFFHDLKSNRLELKPCLCGNCADSWFLKDIPRERSFHAQRKYRRQERARKSRLVVQCWFTLSLRALFIFNRRPS